VTGWAVARRLAVLAVELDIRILFWRFGCAAWRFRFAESGSFVLEAGARGRWEGEADEERCAKIYG